jgi:hypothetical protein
MKRRMVIPPFYGFELRLDRALVDDFVKSPISALRFISLPLRRNASTPRDTRFARLDLGLFTKSSNRATFYEFILNCAAQLKSKTVASRSIRITD